MLEDCKQPMLPNKEIVDKIPLIPRIEPAAVL